MSKFEDMFKNLNQNDLLEEEIVKETSKIIGTFGENKNTNILKFLHSCLDMTSLNTEDNTTSIRRFTKTINDFDNNNLNIPNIAAICVYPAFVSCVRHALSANVRVASVAGGFPSSQTFKNVKLSEVSLAIADGADEIDIVLNIGYFLNENWIELCTEIEDIKKICKNVKLKVILETGLLKSASRIRTASILSMSAGADFIKTSTGKVYPGATPEAVFVICNTILEYYNLYGRKVGIKISGGVRSVDDAIKYYTIVKEILGNEWLNACYFRIGASSLSENLLQLLKNP
jgi:deoxyribose-phosphate aldolase